MEEIELQARMTQKFLPSHEFSKNANLNQAKYNLLQEKAKNNYLGFWADLAHDKISWHKSFTKTRNDSNHPFYKWFEDGELNISYNCLDRHLINNSNKTAIIFEADDGSSTHITYKELYERVCKFANGLKTLDVKLGDTVVIYMPHSIEAIIAMQAVARIGAIHSVVFAGFSAQSLAGRISDANARVIITANAGVRGGKITTLKRTVDEAIDLLGEKNIVEHVIVEERIQTNYNLDKSRDVLWHELIRDQDISCEPTIVSSEHPLFILYTSGSTGKPKGVEHSSGGYLLGTMLTLEWVFDLKENDVFWCTADVGWITGHSYVCYGPLAMGATQVIFEGVPTFPDAGRFWAIIEKYNVTTFYTAPTALRSLIKLGNDLPEKYDLSSLRLLGSVGEPINPEVWLWFYKNIGKNKCPIVDTWWQTETGCHMLSPVPGVTTLKPGSCTLPIPGIMADIVDENGNSVGNNSKGYLVIKKPFPSQIRTIWQNDMRFRDSYFPIGIASGKYYVAGDSAYRDDDGYFWILGRIDDVLNVSGHRLGTQEIESALVNHTDVAEAAVVGKPHSIKGESICAFIICKNTKTKTEEELIKELQIIVAKEIGAIAKPDDIIFVEALPKTRSGKIMRRLLRSIIKKEEITGDLSTLENPSIIEEIKNKLK